MPDAHRFRRVIFANFVPLLCAFLAVVTFICGAALFRYPAGGKGFRILSAEQSWGRLGIDSSATGLVLSMRGRQFLAGLGTHAFSKVTIDPDRDSGRISALIGVDDAARGSGSVAFKILSGDKLLYHSPVLRGTDPPLSIDVAFTEVNRLQLIVSDAGDGVFNDLADWANLRVD